MKPNEFLVNKFLKSWRKIHIFFIKKLCLATKFISWFFVRIAMLRSARSIAKIWFGLWTVGFIGLHFFKPVANSNVIVNGERYCKMVSILFLGNSRLWFTWHVDSKRRCQFLIFFAQIRPDRI